MKENRKKTRNEEIAEEVIQILKEKSLTIKEAWDVTNIVREELHYKAFETKVG